MANSSSTLSFVVPCSPAREVSRAPCSRRSRASSVSSQITLYEVTVLNTAMRANDLYSSPATLALLASGSPSEVSSASAHHKSGC